MRCNSEWLSDKLLAFDIDMIVEPAAAFVVYDGPKNFDHTIAFDVCINFDSTFS